MSKDDDLYDIENEENDKDEKKVELLENPSNNLEKKNSLIDMGFGGKDVKRFNQSINFNQNLVHNEIAKNLNIDENEEDENNDADPEDLFQKPEEMNKTLDDIFTVQMFGTRDPNEKILPFDSRKAGMWERMLHPMQYGSLRGSIFALSSMCLEAGSLTLANRCKDFGLINFLISLILGALIAYWSLIMMIRAARNMKERDYSKVVKLTLGKKIGVFMDINIALYLFGALITFQVIIYNLIGSVAHDIYKIFTDDNREYETFKDFMEGFWDSLGLKFPIMFGVILLVIPLCLLKDVSKMRFASLFGVLALIYSILVIVIESPIFFIKNNLDAYKEMNWFDIRRAFSAETNYSFFSGMATIFYLFACHAGAFPVYKTLRNNTTRRIKKVFRRSILLDLIIYFSVALASYLTAPSDDLELIVYRTSLNGFQNDFFMIVAKIGIIFDLFFSTPANYAALRISVFELIWGNTNITNGRNFVVTISLLLIITLIGVLYSKILAYIALLGGFCSVIYCILIPGLIYVKNSKYGIKSLKNIFTLVIVIGLSIIGYISGFFTILFDIAQINK